MPWIDQEGTARALPTVTIAIYGRVRKQDGTLGLRTTLTLDAGSRDWNVTAADRVLIELLLGCTPKLHRPYETQFSSYRFSQRDGVAEVFLISLKTGGTGLNLTSADYVYLLDPWWNPAVEAQAIDRTHRLGQTRPVLAYRLISGATGSVW